MNIEMVEKYRKGCKENDDKRDAGLRAPDDVFSYSDIKYGPYEENVLDVYVPMGTTDKLPAIISIHGGGWVYGDKELYRHYCMRLSQRGFAVVNFSYRLAPENRYPAALEDCFKVFNWIKENHQDYFIDYDNMFMVGDSAGAQLAQQCLTILTNKEYEKLFTLDIPEDFNIRACGLNCGVYYLCVNKLLKPNDLFMTSAYLPDNYKVYLKQYPVHKYVTSDFPPAFIMTAHHDFIKFMAKPFYNRLKKVGAECEYHIYGDRSRKDIGHVFHVDCREPEGIKCNNDECAFFRKHMK